MIYYKKRSWLKKFILKLKNQRFKANQGEFKFNVLKTLVLPFSFFIAIIYTIYIFILPTYFNEENIEKAINFYLTKNTQLTLDFENPKIYPNYKLAINLKADKIKLKYPNKKDFILIEKPNIDINLITIFQGHIDLNQVKIKSLTINTDFDKNKYTCFNYFPEDILNLKLNNSKLELRNIKFQIDNFKLNIYDKSIKKTFFVLANKVIISQNADNLSILKGENSKEKTYFISAKGNISSNIKYIDFNLFVKFKNKDNCTTNLLKKLSKISYNPIKYLDVYKFKAKADVNLKFKEQKNNDYNIVGNIALKDYYFTINNVVFPKNNLELILDNSSIKSDFNFYFLNNQYLKINAKTNKKQNSRIYANVQSNKIDLKNLKPIVSMANQILNLKIKIDDFIINGFVEANLNVDINSKLNIAGIKSNGSLKIENANLIYQKFGLKLENILATINFNNNKINIAQATAYVSNSKFNLTGYIDEKTNLNLKVFSEKLNISQVTNLINSINFFSKTRLNDLAFNSGTMSINGTIQGNIKKPKIITKCILNNVQFQVKSIKTNLFAKEIVLNASPKNNELDEILININNCKITYLNHFGLINQANLTFLNDNLIFKDLKINLDGILATINGKMETLSRKSPKIELALNATLPKNNKLISIKNLQPNIKAQIEIINDKLNIKEAVVSQNNNNYLIANGKIFEFPDFEKMKFDNLNIVIPTNISMFIPILNNTSIDVNGDLNINGNIQKPEIDGDLKIYNLKYPQLNLFVKNMQINLKKSIAHANIIDAKILGTDFTAQTQAKLLNKKILIEYFNFHSKYVDLDNFAKFGQKLSHEFKNKKIDFEISKIEGNIDSLNIFDILLDNILINGKIKDNILSIQNFKANAFRGAIESSFTFNLATNKVNANAVVKEVNIRLLSSRFKEYSIAASGKLSAFIQTDFESFDYETMLRTSKGYIKFNIDDGELAQFAKLERFLQAGNILTQSIFKLSLNSIISTIAKQNTGYFKTIEGTIKISDGFANIQYINTQGANMSMNIIGKINLINNTVNVRILGRIPSSIVNVMGDVGKFNAQSLIDRMAQDTREIINSLSISPFEKMFSTTVPKEEYEKIPPLVNVQNELTTREFIVNVIGNPKNTSSVKNFKWIVKD